MKRSIVTALALVAVLAAAGDARAETEYASDFKLDLAVPESPALNVLETRPGRILRPATTRELGLAFEDFLNEDDQFRLPATFGAEFAPVMLLAGPKLSVSEYQDSPWLYRTRLSLATGEISPDGTARRLGIGLRTAIIDKSDLRTNGKFVVEATALARAINDLLAAKRKELGLGGPTLAEIEELPEVKAAVERLTAAHLERWAADVWNAPMWEVAFAWGGSTDEDTASATLVTDHWALWTTYAAGLGDWGQWLLGYTGESKRPAPGSGHEFFHTAATRLYAGGNKLKGFVEGQFTGSAGLRPGWYFNGGGEVRVRDNLWFTFQLGYEENRETGAADIRADIGVNLGVWAFPVDLTRLGELARAAGG